MYCDDGENIWRYWQAGAREWWEDRPGSTDVPTIVTLDPLTWGDYVGSTYSRSNARVVQREYTGLYESGILDTYYAGAGSEITYIDVPALLDATDEEWEQVAELCDTLAHTEDEYPLIDEEDHSELEWELFEEAWDDYLRRDYSRESDLSEDQVQEAFEYATREGFLDDYPYSETATGSVIWHSFERWLPDYCPVALRSID